MRLASRRETVALGRRIATKLRPGDLVLLDGDLGTGKTFLARAILRTLGARERVVGSPTFALVHEYETARAIVLHVDLYRLLGPPDDLRAEVEHLGLRERRGEGCVLLVEWGADALEPLGGEPCLRLRIRTVSDHERDVSIAGERAGDMVA